MNELLLLTAVSLAITTPIMIAPLVIALYYQRQQWLVFTQTDDYQEWLRISQIEKRERIELKQRQRQVAKIAEQIRKKFITSTTELGFYRVLEKRGAKRKYDRIKCRTKICGVDYIVLRVDSMPWGQKPLALVEPDILDNLKLKMGRPDMTPHPTPYDGLFFEIPLKGSYAGVPEYFAWEARSTNRHALAQLGRVNAGPLAIAAGQASNRRFVYLDLAGEDGPHLLVAGTTGGGKSVFLNQLICTMLLKNRSDELQFCFIDLKRNELWGYRKIPHLWHPIVLRAAQVPAIMERIEEEMEARMDLFQKYDIQDIDEWQKRFPDNKLPRLIIVFDEIANVMRWPETKKQMESLLANLAALGRAFGIHLILCTQRPDSDVVTGLVKTNVTTRICFNTDNWGSRVVLNNEMANGLKPRGRAVVKVGSAFTIVQAPFIEKKEIKASVKTAKTMIPPPPPFSAKDVWQAMLDNPGTEPEIYELVQDHLSYHELHSLIKEWHYRPWEQAPVINHNDDRYILYQSRLVSVNGTLPTSYLEIDLTSNDGNEE